MEARRLKSAADVGDVGQSVEVTKDSVTIDQNQIGVCRVRSVEARQDQSTGARPLFDRLEVRVARLVRCDDEPPIGNLLPDAHPRGQKVLLVGGPRRAGDESWSRGAERINQC